MNKLRLLTGAALLSLGTYAGTATAGVDVHIGVGVPGTVYYDGWAPSYRGSFAYQDAIYGYRGYYVSRSEYAHYFREGFRRGYEDGYYTRSRFGRYDDGNHSILQAVLSVILNLQNI